ncbi:MAG: mechanosensitive ion channel family protein [Candidatus Coproplasma sp.]
MENKAIDKKTVRKVIKITAIVIIALFILFCVIGVIIEAAAPELPFSLWVKENMWDISTLPDSWNQHKKTLIHCLLLISVILSASWLLRLIFKKLMAKSNRAKTVITLLDGLIKYGSALALIFLVLQACGVNTTAIWESVGIITLIIGLGAQSLIADIIAGVFIIFEDEYSVGEIVSIDNFRGTVAEIGIRATKILDMAGNIKIINNSDIKNVVNLSRELSLAVVDCEFPYDVPLEFIEKLLKDNLTEFKAKIPAIVEGPFYKGVSYYAASNVAVKIVAQCHEEDRYQVQRDLLREYRQLIVAHGIDVSFEQVVINQPVKKDYNMTPEIVEEAEEFVSEQKNASDGLEEQEHD